MNEQIAGVGQTVTGEKWAISLTSAKTYTELADELFSEEPDEGKIFLALFFTLTGDVAAGKKLKGYLAWQVSTDWSELEVSYKSSLWDSGKAATFKVTPADITE